MASEPAVPARHDGDHPQRLDLRRRSWWTLPSTVVVFAFVLALALVLVLAVFGHRLGWFAMAPQHWAALALSLPVALWAGWRWPSKRPWSPSR